ncbi:NAD(P)H-dependent glycerol-3-phosphate dehydrogenase [Turicibacter sp. TJ11]|uniref:NAD(P)H-dependent glycerol-3-phosphate dehydrogenase n=1 Tax=Turicibacter sp. TJ11 TaxID=2806443 RepID=UPI001F38BA0A|nr:NAD(P)H-dependent glycerol-3-phosphate dehydrogenase [Turicibacter sp. TJ11]
MTKNITVIGAGSWGTALAQVLCDNKNNVTLYDLNQDVVNDINQNHQNSRFFADITLPSSLVATTNLKEALKEAQLILLSVPTKVMRDVLKSINQELDHQVMIINASKGIEPGTHKRVSEIVKEEIDPNYLEAFVALTGPSHAEEVIERAVTTVTCASTVAEKANIIQEMFNNQYFRVYRVDDLIGVEIGGSIKNVIALAAGIIAGLGYGDNAKAALITRGLVEIKRLGTAVGAKEETFSGLSGLGDLIVTCTSVHSRNWQAGYKIGSGSDLQEAIDSMTMVVEGVRTCQATYEMIQSLQIEMPIVETVYGVIFNKLDPRDAIAQLMMRDMKPEFY